MSMSRSTLEYHPPHSRLHLTRLLIALTLLFTITLGIVTPASANNQFVARKIVDVNITPDFSTNHVIPSNIQNRSLQDACNKYLKRYYAEPTRSLDANTEIGQANLETIVRRTPAITTPEPGVREERIPLLVERGVILQTNWVQQGEGYIHVRRIQPTRNTGAIGINVQARYRNSLEPSNTRPVNVVTLSSISNIDFPESAVTEYRFFKADCT